MSKFLTTAQALPVAALLAFSPMHASSVPQPKTPPQPINLAAVVPTPAEPPVKQDNGAPIAVEIVEGEEAKPLVKKYHEEQATLTQPTVRFIVAAAHLMELDDQTPQGQQSVRAFLDTRSQRTDAVAKAYLLDCMAKDWDVVARQKNNLPLLRKAADIVLNALWDVIRERVNPSPRLVGLCDKAAKVAEDEAAAPAKPRVPSRKAHKKPQQSTQPK